MPFKGHTEAYRPAKCSHFDQKTGYCKYGEECTYAHGYIFLFNYNIFRMTELLFHPAIYKTKPCKSLLEGKPCDAGKYCCYSHGIDISF